MLLFFNRGSLVWEKFFGLQLYNVKFRSNLRRIKKRRDLRNGRLGAHLFDIQLQGTIIKQDTL